MLRVTNRSQTNRNHIDLVSSRVITAKKPADYDLYSTGDARNIVEKRGKILLETHMTVTVIDTYRTRGLCEFGRDDQLKIIFVQSFFGAIYRRVMIITFVIIFILIQSIFLLFSTES